MTNVAQPRHEPSPSYARALTLLTGRSYATRELRRRLLDSGFEVAEVDATIARLTAAGLLDDAAYARQVARSHLADRGTGLRRVRQTLAAKGVERGVIDAAVDEVLVDEGIDEAATAERLALRRATTLGALDPVTRRRRLYAYLARRGFAPDDVRRAVEKALSE